MIKIGMIYLIPLFNSNVVWRTINTFLNCEMSERIILSLTAFHGPAEECAKLGKKIVNGILTALLWSTSLRVRKGLGDMA